MHKVHDIKVFPEYFKALIDEEHTKTFEIRKNDRGYKVDDHLMICEWNNIEGQDGVKAGYTGRKIIVRITYITDFKQKPGYVVLGIR